MLEFGISVGELGEVRRQLTLGEVGGIELEEPGSANDLAGDEPIELETAKGSLDRGQGGVKHTAELSRITAAEQSDC